MYSRGFNLLKDIGELLRVTKEIIRGVNVTLWGGTDIFIGTSYTFKDLGYVLIMAVLADR